METAVRKCTKCKVTKLIGEYYDKKNGKFGKHAECKKCLYERSKEWKRNNVEKVRIYENFRRMKARSLYLNESQKLAYERSATAFEIYAQAEMRKLSQTLLEYAIKRKYIESKTTCEICGSQEDIYPLIPDLNEVLKVKWLCRECEGLAYWRGYGREMDTEGG